MLKCKRQQTRKCWISKIIYLRYKCVIYSKNSSFLYSNLDQTVYLISKIINVYVFLWLSDEQLQGISSKMQFQLVSDHVPEQGPSNSIWENPALRFREGILNKIKMRTPWHEEVNRKLAREAKFLSFTRNKARKTQNLDFSGLCPHAPSCCPPTVFVP